MIGATPTIHQVLDQLRAPDLTTDPEWVANFADVWLWSDWHARHGRPDIGIDLGLALVPSRATRRIASGYERRIPQRSAGRAT